MLPIYYSFFYIFWIVLLKRNKGSSLSCPLSIYVLSKYSIFVLTFIIRLMLTTLNYLISLHSGFDSI